MVVRDELVAHLHRLERELLELGEPGPRHADLPRWNCA
jgi:hypothetical protein